MFARLRHTRAEPNGTTKYGHYEMLKPSIQRELFHVGRVLYFREGTPPP